MAKQSELQSMSQNPIKLHKQLAMQGANQSTLPKAKAGTTTSGYEKKAKAKK